MNCNTHAKEDQDDSARPLENFSWSPNVDPNATVAAGRVADFLDIVTDISIGLAVVLELAEDRMIASGNGETPYLNEYHMGCLLRASIRAARLMDDKATEFRTEMEIPAAKGVH